MAHFLLDGEVIGILIEVGFGTCYGEFSGRHIQLLLALFIISAFFQTGRMLTVLIMCHRSSKDTIECDYCSNFHTGR